MANVKDTNEMSITKMLAIVCTPSNTNIVDVVTSQTSNDDMAIQIK